MSHSSGGGGLFFYLQPKEAVINDLNKQLIGMYRQIKDDPEGVCRELSDLQNQYNSKHTMEEKDFLYYKFRNKFNEYIKGSEVAESSLEAALLIFLNKTGFNALYRVNKSGIYDVPSNHKKIVNAYDPENIKAVSKTLERSNIMCGDFENACTDAVAGDFVFFDSPYYKTFDAYQQDGFSEADHIRLFNLFKKLSDDGVYCMMTNSNCDFIKDLYKDYNIRVVNVRRSINSDGNNRTGQEVIVTNYDSGKYCKKVLLW